MTIKIKKLHDNARIPAYAHSADQDAGMDLYSVEHVVLRPFVPTLVKTGLSIELPPYYEGQVRSRSGLALKHGVSVLNAPGTLDPSYRGELGVILVWNGYTWNLEGSDRMYTVKTGDRIAQLVVAKYEPVEFEEAELSESERGSGGFGSSGV